MHTQHKPYFQTVFGHQNSTLQLNKHSYSSTAMSSRPSQRASLDASRRPLRTPTSSRPPTTNGPFKKIHRADLPVTTTGSGHNIIDIKNSLINYCLSHDMSRISKMFTDGRYLSIPAPTLDPDRVGHAPTGELQDPRNLYIETFKENLKHHASEEISHNKSQEKLLSLLPSCTSKEFEDKISDRAEKAIRINLAGGTPEEIEAATNVLPSIDPADPLQTWANIIYLVTTRASGNRRIDQDTATVSFANHRQRHGESLFDYASRSSFSPFTSHPPFFTTQYTIFFIVTFLHYFSKYEAFFFSDSSNFISLHFFSFHLSGSAICNRRWRANTSFLGIQLADRQNDTKKI